MSVSGQACWSPMCLQSGMLVSDGGMLVSHGSTVKLRSPMKYVIVEVSDKACRGLRWISNQACWFPMDLRTGMLVSDGSLMGPRSEMLVSNGPLIRHVSLRRSQILIIFS